MKLRRLGFILLIALATVVALQYLDSETAIERASASVAHAACVAGKSQS